MESRGGTGQRRTGYKKGADSGGSNEACEVDLWAEDCPGASVPKQD